MKKINKKSALNPGNVQISKELRDIIHGYIMSDGHVRAGGILLVNQSKKQEKFVEWLYEKLKDLRTDTPILDSVKIHPKTKKASYSKSFATKSFLVGFHRMWYKPCINDKGVTVFKKSLPKSIHCFFNPTFLTLWFAGDGTKILGSIGAKFEVTAFTEDERQTLKALFRKKFNIKVQINKAGFSKTGTQQWTININASEYQRFRNLITKMDLIENYFPHKLHPKA